jgi:hypothetical protein
MSTDVDALLGKLKALRGKLPPKGPADVELEYLAFFKKTGFYLTVLKRFSDDGPTAKDLTDFNTKKQEIAKLKDKINDAGKEQKNDQKDVDQVLHNVMEMNEKLHKKAGREERSGSSLQGDSELRCNGRTGRCARDCVVSHGLGARSPVGCESPETPRMLEAPRRSERCRFCHRSAFGNLGTYHRVRLTACRSECASRRRTNAAACLPPRRPVNRCRRWLPDPDSERVCQSSGQVAVTDPGRSTGHRSWAGDPHW